MKLILTVFSALVFLCQTSFAKSILVDCYGSNGGAGWNNVSLTTAGATAVLKDGDDEDTGVTLTVSNRMTAGTSSVSSSSFTGDALEFVDSGSNGAFGSVTSWNSNPPCLRSDLVFSGLDTNVAYTFTYFASRNNDDTGWSREGEYILQGASTVTNYLDAADNFSDVAISDPVYPDSSGKILLTLGPGPNNNADAGNGRYYFYLNAFKIEFDDSVPVEEVIYIDPTSGAGYIGDGWNGINFLTENSTLALTATNDSSSGISATVVTVLAGLNSSGSSSPTNAASEFAAAGGDSVYGCDVTFNGGLSPTGMVRFSGMNTNVAYSFTMYASRMGATDTRDALYTLSGANTDSAVLDAAGNDSEVVVVSDIYPNAAGEIEFSMTGGPGNNNSYGFFYLSAMKIEYIPAERNLPLIADFYVDATGSNTGTNWNQIQAHTTDSSATLLTSDGTTSPYTIKVAQRLTSVNYDASGIRVDDAAEFDPMGGACAYGDSSNPQGILQLTGLNPAYLYDFTFFASRMGATDVREALYTVAGAVTNSAVLDAVDNLSEVCVVSDIQPTAEGVIDIFVEEGPVNNSGYFYLGAMKVSVFGEGSLIDTPVTNAAKNLLFFGNSFTINGDVSGLVQDLAVVAGYDQPLVVADLLGGQDLAYHISQVEGYPETNVASSSLPAGQTWDHVIIQGYSTEATHLRDPMVFKTNAVSLYQLVKYHSSSNGVDTEAVLYETWARSPAHSYYPDTFDDPAAMQLEIRTNYNGAAELITAAEGAGSVRIAPVGDAYETGDFDLDLYADDEYHQSVLGAHLNAMVLFKTIYDHDVTNISYTAAVAAGWTTMTSNQWHDLTMWADGVATTNAPVEPEVDQSLKDVIYIDPYGNDAPDSWNYWSFTSLGSISLIDAAYNETGINMEITDAIQSGNSYGSTSPTGDAAEFAPAGATAAYGSNSDLTCTAVFTGMKPGREYTFTFYGSRMNVTDNREGLFSLSGLTQVSGGLDASGNSSEVISLSLKPASDGRITLQISKGSNNNNSSGYYYISAMKIESHPSGTLILFK